MAETKTETQAPKAAQATSSAKDELAFPAPSEYKGDLPEGVNGGVATIDNPEKVAVRTK